MLKKANFHGILLLLLMFVVVIGLLTSNPQTTGFAVKEIQQYKDDIIVNENEEKSCIGDIPQGKCSSTKPLYCNDGNLVYNCYECGCNKGQTCGEQGVCNKLQKCVDGSFYEECSTLLNGKFCDEGELTNYCDLCGCREGYSCEDNKCRRSSQ
tara:strand:- start:1389 stop:1847 length:459 start_codon:yes stop_codon:yes gene_type:complete